MTPQYNLNRRLFIATVICAVLAFCIPVLFLFKYTFFPNLWLLYLGNALFATVMFCSVVYYNKQKHEDANLASLIVLNLKIMFTSIVVICILLLLLLLMFNADTLKQTPVNAVHDKTNGLTTILYINATLVNFIIGSLATVLASVGAKRSQKADGE